MFDLFQKHSSRTANQNGVSRRELIGLCAAALALPAAAETRFRGDYYRKYSQCLPDYLTSLARAAYAKRNQALASVTTQAAVRKRQEWARETFWKLIGGNDLERTPLNPKITGSFEREGYRLEKVVYESRPNFFVSANWYIPTTGKPPYSGVLFQMGHSSNGKAYDSYQKCCQGLARLGYLVLAFDPMGQGERIYYPDSSGIHTRLDSADTEHTLPGKQLLLTGDSSSRIQVWDAVRSLDYLASHPLVDTKKLASTGQSGGATLTMMLSCVDERLAAAVVSSGNTENVACADFDSPGSTDDAEQDFIGSGTVGFDRWDLFYPLAPKPMLILVSAHDFFGTYSPRYLSSGHEQYLKLQRIYGILGHSERLDWQDTPLPHGLSYSLRMATYNWFERWLKGNSKGISEEPPVKPEEERELWACPTGNTVRDFNSLRPFDLAKKRASSPTEAKPLPVHQPPAPASLRIVATTEFGELTVQAAEVMSAPSVWLPAWVYSLPDSSKDAPAFLLLDEHGRRGRHEDVLEDSLYDRLARRGSPVCAADIRGVGDLRPEVGRGAAGYNIEHASEEDYAWSSLILGKPLLTQRAEDIIALARAWKDDRRNKGRRLVVAARGRMAVPALFAALSCPAIDSLYLAGGLISLRSVVETEDYRQPLANMAWGLLNQTDLPAVAAAIAPRKLILAGPVDGAGNAAGADLVRTLYPGAHISVRPKAEWDLSVFQEL